MIKMMLIAGVGGFIGTSLRFLTGKFCHLIVVSTFPLGTFVVNVVGSFIIGVLFGLVEKGNLISPTMNVLLITGFCGGFTTFSTFADDIYMLISQKHWLTLGVYAPLSVVLGVLMVMAGRMLIKSL